jgi:hypothetical protein
MVQTGVKHIDKNQILFNVEGDTFKIKIGEDLDLEEVYTILLSALVYLEDLAMGMVAHPESKELH